MTFRSAELVEEIRRILADPQGVSEDRFKELAAEYTEQTSALNKLTSTATTYYNRGFYCEAARLIEEEDLIEEFQTLHFPEMQDWRDVCDALELSFPESVSSESGTELQLFWIQYQENKELFVQNRKLALENAPASERLDVLYRLFALFPNSVGWIRSIDLLEKRRNDELTAFARSITKYNVDRALCQKAIDELESPARRTPPPKDVLKILKNALVYSHNVELREAFLELLDDWSVAVENEDEELAYSTLGDYRLLTESNPVETSALMERLTDDQRRRLNAALTYSQRIERRYKLESDYRRKETILETMLANDSDANEIETALSELELASESLGRAKLPQVAETAREYLDELARLKARRRFLVTSVVVVLLVAFMGGVGFVTYQQAFTKRVEDATTEIETALDEYSSGTGDVDALDRAGKKIEKCLAKDPKFADVDRFAEAVDKYEKARASEDKRVRDFADAVDQLERSHAEKRSNAPALDTLKRLARTEEEKSVYNKTRRADDAFRREERKVVEDSFSKKLEDLRGKVEALKTAPAESYNESLAKAAPIRRELTELGEQAKLYSVATPLETGRVQLLATLDGVERRILQTKTSLTLGAAVGNVDTFLSATTELVSTSRVDEQLKERAETVSAELRNVSRIASWNEFAQSNQVDVLRWTTDANVFADASEDIDANETSFNLSPEFSKIRELRAQLEPFCDSGGCQTALDQTRKLAKKYSQPLWLLYHEDTERYYYLLESVKFGDAREIKQLISNDGMQKPFQSTFIDPEDTIGQAPQYVFYKDVEEFASKDSMTRQEWFDFVSDSLETLVKPDDKRFDPAVKCLLLHRFLKIVVKDPVFANFQDWIDQLENEGELNEVVDIYKQEAQNVNLNALRERAKKALKPLDVDALDDKLSDSQQTLAKEATNVFLYRWVGFIDVVDGVATVTFGADLKPQADAELYVALQADASVRSCGKLTDDKVQLSEGEDWNASLWTPVYEKVLVKR